MRRINIALTDNQYKAISKEAGNYELKPGTFCRLAALTAAKIQIFPDEFTMPKKIKQLDLFHTKGN